jgi:hypothetical protein
MYTIGGSERAAGGCRRRRYSVYLLYWYKSTNTDAAASHLPPLQSKLLKASTCNRYSVYLLYWDKSTNTDTRICANI